MVPHLLDNPVYNALNSGDASLSFGTENIKFFDEAVSPFAGFSGLHKNGFDALYEMLSPGRNILYATTKPIDEPKGWQLIAAIKGLQFVFEQRNYNAQLPINPVPLNKTNVQEMVNLASLTKPGPFAERTIDFGNYFGIFEDGKLVAMTGQRLHVANYSEVSAVCTHPDYLGKGYASILLQQQLNIICGQEQIPFLHVREDNIRAIKVYERFGFKVREKMNFYFLKSRR